jgi:anti-anti-sigma regulatory factor
MASRTRSRPEARKITLAADLRIGTARAAFESITAGPNAGGLDIDASQVERVDAAGLQALVAALARLRAARVTFHLRAMSGALASAAQLAGLSAALERK